MESLPTLVSDLLLFPVSRNGGVGRWAGLGTRGGGLCSRLVELTVLRVVQVEVSCGQLDMRVGLQCRSRRLGLKREVQAFCAHG